MANTIASGTIASTLNANDWGGLFSHVYTFTSTISDNDAVAQHAHGVFDATVTGVALGDMVGYDFTFEAQEPNPMQLVADYTTTPFDNSAFTINAIQTS